MRNSKEVGNLTQLQCITKFYELGCDVNIPFGNSQKYDLIIDWNNRLYKIQIKHANENEDKSCFSFKTRWQGHNSTGYTQTTYTKNDIDFFATYYNDNLYLIPVEQCSGTIKNLRVLPCKNGQTKGILFAKDFKLEDIIKTL